MISIQKGIHVGLTLYSLGLSFILENVETVELIAPYRRCHLFLALCQV